MWQVIPYARPHKVFFISFWKYKEEESQVNGVLMVMDLKNVGWKHVKNISPLYSKRIMSLLQVRHTGSLNHRAAGQSSPDMTHSYCVYSSPRLLKIWVSNGKLFFQCWTIYRTNFDGSVISEVRYLYRRRRRAHYLSSS